MPLTWHVIDRPRGHGQADGTPTTRAAPSEPDAAQSDAALARTGPPVLGARLGIEGNLVRTALSLVALFAWLSPSAGGTVRVPLQAVVVAAFAALQYRALRGARSQPALD
ncbi:hypothetical protein ACIREE_14025 [Streptomyces sp. NPDC102467]|uniref:hypothetical protein n=1 Tax=Streptomyces sp. NPDC102467 TaxID=3366179 RepID=UPI00380832C6